MGWLYIQEIRDNFKNGLESCENLWQEIRLRRELLQQLVGTLYPWILQNEIEELLEMRGEVWKRV
jgi:hypothetical protein